MHRSYDTAATAALDPARLTDSSGLLLIVDYAVRWPISDLLALARDPLLRTGLPTRVLLLSRPAGLWWDNLSFRLSERFDMATDQTAFARRAGRHRGSPHRRVHRRP